MDKSGRLNPEALAESDAVLVEKQHLTEGKYLQRAATLLFHPDPEKFTTGACVKIGFFRTDSDLLYHDVISGDLFTQVDKTLDLLLTKYLRAGISYEGSQRLERFPVPEAALREAVINAITHKDYGALIRDTCLAHGSPAPLFDADSTGFWVKFPFPVVRDAEKISVKTPVKTPVETPVKTPLAILVCLGTNPGWTLVEVAAEIGKSIRAVERASAKLVVEGKLRYVGPKKGGSWVVLK